MFCLKKSGKHKQENKHKKKQLKRLRTGDTKKVPARACRLDLPHATSDLLGYPGTLRWGCLGAEHQSAVFCVFAFASGAEQLENELSVGAVWG